MNTNWHNSVLSFSAARGIWNGLVSVYDEKYVNTACSRATLITHHSSHEVDPPSMDAGGAQSSKARGWLGRHVVCVRLEAHHNLKT